MEEMIIEVKKNLDNVIEEIVAESNGIEIEPLFLEKVDFDTFSKSDFRVVIKYINQGKKIEIISNHKARYNNDRDIEIYPVFQKLALEQLKSLVNYSK